MSQKTEKHTFQAEIQQLLDIVIHSLYTDKEILDFFGKNDGTTLKGFEVVFSQMRTTFLGGSSEVGVLLLQ